MDRNSEIERRPQAVENKQKINSMLKSAHTSVPYRAVDLDEATMVPEPWRLKDLLKGKGKMPKITAYGNTFRDWEGLLGAVERNATTVVVDDALKAELANLLAKVREIKVEQEDLLGKSRGMTEVLRQTVDDGREVARKIRAQVLGRLGSKTELLKQYGIPPGRRRTRAPKTPLTPPPTIGKPQKNEELPGNPTEPASKQ
jgi:hypothetical protein